MEPPAGAAPASSVYETVALLVELWRRMASAAGFAPAIFCVKGRRVDWATPRGREWRFGQDGLATSTFARWRSDLTELRGQNGIRDRTCTD